MSLSTNQEAVRLPDPSLADRDVAIASKGHFTGQIVLGDDHGRLVQLESHDELECCLCLAIHPQTQDLFEQVELEWHDEDGEVHSHYVDFLVVRRDGRRVAYAVRPRARQKIAFLEELSTVASQAVEYGAVTDFRLLTKHDFDPTTRHNARLLHAVRARDAAADAAAADVVREMTGVRSLADLTQEIGLGAMGFRALLRLVRSRHLELERHERIAPASNVFNGKQV
ncbi:hypothetical protein [Salipiger mucosus]|uniref:TnsA endonuclease N-terminal domain-containing protein n=1 Tax=Salipiger mucosus DSM 16094 TaxID=1123237 RepID=S9Q4Y5_9RHOB|nr:hypothetical protein [Salipiger mucosus]EPX76421.1 hypothetical protein Salmuc_00307 [Salipiger mucosus DSM 16094]